MSVRSIRMNPWSEILRRVDYYESLKTHICNRNDPKFTAKSEALLSPTRPTIVGRKYINTTPGA